MWGSLTGPCCFPPQGQGEGNWLNSHGEKAVLSSGSLQGATTNQSPLPCSSASSLLAARGRRLLPDAPGKEEAGPSRERGQKPLSAPTPDSLFPQPPSPFTGLSHLHGCQQPLPLAHLAHSLPTAAMGKRQQHPWQPPRPTPLGATAPVPAKVLQKCGVGWGYAFCWTGITKMPLNYPPPKMLFFQHSVSEADGKLLCC